jgi:hypothetical protein
MTTHHKFIIKYDAEWSDLSTSVSNCEQHKSNNFKYFYYVLLCTWVTLQCEVKAH